VFSGRVAGLGWQEDHIALGSFHITIYIAHQASVSAPVIALFESRFRAANMYDYPKRSSIARSTRV
jgi:hypothetical protein